MKKEKQIRVNICWELGVERKCETLNKDHAYATRKYIEDNDGVVFWFQPLGRLIIPTSLFFILTDCFVNPMTS